MLLDKFGRNFHDGRRRIPYNILKVKEQLYYVIPLNIPCTKSTSRCNFPLKSAIVMNAVIIMEADGIVDVKIDGRLVLTMLDMVRKQRDGLGLTNYSGKMLYVQLLLKCSMQAE